MKLFKNISFIFIAILLVFSLAGCKDKNIEGSLSDIMKKVYADVKEDEKPMGLSDIEVTDENIEYYLGTKDIEYESALASESMVGSIAYSVVLVRLDDNSDVEATKTKIKENINPRKWICVGVEEEDVIVENKGNLIILIMVQDETTREKINQGFNNL